MRSPPSGHLDCPAAHFITLQLTYGRGGGGNVSRSRSRDPATIDRSRSREPGYGSGRGGAGNISETPRHSELESLDEDERRIYEVKHQQQHAHDM